ncbi:hypothetical protein EW146_g7828, partial [Bondarzewia mesenterica]
SSTSPSSSFTSPGGVVQTSIYYLIRRTFQYSYRRDSRELQRRWNAKERNLVITIINLEDRATMANYDIRASMMNLDRSILLHREALRLRPYPHPHRRESLIKLADALEERSNRTISIQDLDEAVTLYREALRSQRLLPALYTFSPGHPGTVTNNLALLLGRRFEQTGWIDDLEEAVSFHREALSLHPATHPDRPLLLNNLGNMLRIRFEHVGQLDDLEEAVSLHRQISDMRVVSKIVQRSSLNNLAAALRALFHESGQLSHLEEAISLHRQVLELCLAPHFDRSRSLNNLANAIITRFERTGQLGDLNEAITLHRQALELFPAPHPNRPGSLHNLANVIHTRFEQTSEFGDLEEAVSLQREALELFPATHPWRWMSLYNLAIAVKSRFWQTGQVDDLEEAISLHRQALELSPALHPQRLSSLSNSLLTRFGQTGHFSDLEEAIALDRQALQLTPANHVNRPRFLNSLAHALYARFDQRGQLDDLEEAVSLLQKHSSYVLHLISMGQLGDLEKAVSLHRQALQLLPASHTNRADLLNNIANAVLNRFRQTGQLGDLDEAVSLHREALELHHAPHPKRLGSLNNLANVLLTRFWRADQFTDLEEAITLHRQALELRPAPHPDRWSSLNGLGTAIHSRFGQTNELGDLEEAALLHREALELRPAPHPDRSKSLNNLANTFVTLYEQRGQVGDLEEAISLHRQTVDLRPEPHPKRASSLHNLSRALHMLFGIKGQLIDLEGAISTCRQSLDLLPLDHPIRCQSLCTLGKLLVDMYSRTKYSQHLYDAVAAFRAAVECTSASASDRFTSARDWARRTDGIHESALEAYQSAIGLLPRIAMLGLNLQSRQEGLSSRSDGLASDAAACAIRFGQLDRAVEFLEEGRAVFWTQALRLRTPLDELRKAAPELAQKLEDISRALEQGSYRDISRNPSDSAQKVMSMVREAVHYRHLEDDWTATLKEIRNMDGFETFLGPKRFSALERAASHGPVVILNASRSSCNALIVTLSGIHHIPISGLSSDAAVGLIFLIRLALSSEARSTPLFSMLGKSFIAMDQNSIPPTGSEVMQFSLDSFPEEVRNDPDFLRLLDDQDRHGKRLSSRTLKQDDVFHAVLAKLWTCIVGPVLRFLDMKKSDSPPRLWWCPTGPFAFLPIHAAGMYDIHEHSECISDHVVSSYTHTLNALLSPVPNPENPFKMLAVIQPQTPGYSSLPSTVLELRKIEGQVPEDVLIRSGLQGTPSTVENVAAYLSTATIAHFACHGIQDAENPLESGLVLSDGRLTVSRIMQQPMPNASLAFLSACQTAMGDDKLPDEAMHLAATLLFAGFRGTVATMWSIYDEDGPKIVDSFYEYLFQDDAGGQVASPDTTRAARALTLAVAKLRDQNAPFIRWVPFVHFGL